MDFKVIAAASRPDLVRYAAAAADNGSSLLADAELLLTNSRHARAYALAALSIEEFGKAAGLVTLAVMPDHLRCKVPLHDLLEWHVVKQTGGLILTMLQLGIAPGVAARINDSPAPELAQMLASIAAQAQDTDRMKKRGLYADLQADGSIWQPDQITASEADDQLHRATQVAASGALFAGDEALQKLANPSAEAMTASEVLFVRYFEAVEPKNAEAAAKAAKDGLDQLLMHLLRQASQQPTTGRAPSDAAAGITATGTPVPDTTSPDDPSPTHAQP